MLNTLIDDLFLSQKIEFKKKFTNKELLLFQYFKIKTKTFAENIIIINKNIFYFVKKNDYFKAKMYQHSLRMDAKNMKVIVISSEKILIKQIFSFFPDTFIYDIKLELDDKKGYYKIILFFLSYKDRGIAIGNSGEYIGAINYIFQNYIFLKGNFGKRNFIKIECNLI
ncbi:MAG: hypothetical protein ACFFBP_02120 [Promethearchaeota archaeon]